MTRMFMEWPLDLHEYWIYRASTTKAPCSISLSPLNLMWILPNMPGLLDFIIPWNLPELREDETCDGSKKCCEIGMYKEGDKQNVK